MVTRLKKLVRLNFKNLLGLFHEAGCNCFRQPEYKLTIKSNQIQKICVLVVLTDKPVQIIDVFIIVVQNLPVELIISNFFLSKTGIFHKAYLNSKHLKQTILLKHHEIIVETEESRLNHSSTLFELDPSINPQMCVRISIYEFLIKK
ncbi:hypothetical protein BpHYR1_023197 [Brachionus plicatilis]|uniref:Uncharacterized protein n=1 Tax=Brachionus plicatilis TaxID=10195 RepID=A0A3M7PU00_BRAPC|nr:hypothetical protein BpHYR1_023197 [Brachionus plicatilis]